MSDLELRINADLVEAMKSKEGLRVSVLRMLKSAVQLAQIEKGRKVPLTEDEVVLIVGRLIKQRNEAAEMYSSGGAADRAQAELDEAKILSSYRPEQISDDELEKMVAKIISETKAAGTKDLGRVMGKMIPAVRGRAEGGRIKELVLKHLKPGS